MEVHVEALTHDEIIDRIDEHDAAVFVPGSSFGWYEPVDSGEPVAAVEIAGLEWLEEKLRADRVTCQYYGIGREIEGVPLPLFLHFRLNVAPLYIWIDDADDEWKASALQRVCAIFPPGPDGKRAYLCTGPMQQWGPKGIVLPPTFNAPRVGRNEPCPCGSGRKHKRCCGA